MLHLVQSNCVAPVMPSALLAPMHATTILATGPSPKASHPRKAQMIRAQNGVLSQRSLILFVRSCSCGNVAIDRAACTSIQRSM